MGGFNGKTRPSDEQVLMFRPWIPEVKAALSNDIEVFARVQHLFLVFSEEYGHHFFSVGEAILPILVVEVLLDVFLALRLVLSHDELVEGVFQDTLEDPLAQDLEVGLGTLLQEEFEKITDGFVRGVDH